MRWGPFHYMKKVNVYAHLFKVTEHRITLWSRLTFVIEVRKVLLPPNPEAHLARPESGEEEVIPR